MGDSIFIRCSRAGVYNLIRLLVVCLLAAGFLSAQAQIKRNFTSRYTTNTQGNIGMASNTLLSCSTASGATGRSSCNFARNGGSRANNQHFMTYIDDDGDGATFNSSSANFTLPAGSSVLWAGLYWGADTSRGGGTAGSGESRQAAPNPNARNQVKFKVASGAYQTLTATQVDAIGNDYQGFVEVTSLVNSQAAGSTRNYGVADVQSGTGTDRDAGWSLVVVYSDPAEVLRNLTVFDGFALVSSRQRTINTSVSGFLTPPSGTFKAEVGIIAYEGDRPYTGPQFRLDGVRMGDSVNSTTNFFNSTISKFGSHVTSKSPNYQNQLGYDAKIVDAQGRLSNGATTVNLTFVTTGDWYFPGVLTFSVEIFQPDLSTYFPKTVTDLNGGTVQPGDILEYSMTVQNLGNDPATNVLLTDVIPAGTSYVANSATIDSNPDGSANVTYNATNDQLSFRLGTAATASTGGTLQPPMGATAGEEATVRFRVKVDTTISMPNQIDNQASLAYKGFTTGDDFSSISDDPATPNQGDPTMVALSTLEVDLGIVKDDSLTEAIAGQSITYTLSVSNNSTVADVFDALVSDTFDASLFNVAAASISCTPANCGAETLTGTTYSIPVDIPKNSTVDIDISIPILSNATGTLYNSASVAVPSNIIDPVAANNTNDDSTTLKKEVKLSVSKDNSITSLAAGSQTTYSITIANPASGSSDLVGASVTDTLDPNKFLSLDSWSCVATGSATCSAGPLTGAISDTVNIPAGESLSYTVNATLRADAYEQSPVGQVSNTVTVALPAGTSNQTGGQLSATDTDTLTQEADLSVSKSHSGNFVIGQSGNYTLKLENLGSSNHPLDATNPITLTDTLPANFDFNAAAGTGWTCNYSAPNVTCTHPGPLSVSSSLPEITLQVTPLASVLASPTDSSVTVTNELNSSSIYDSNAANNQALDPTTVTVADLTLSKTHTANFVRGKNESYEITVTNSGDAPSTALVNVSDILPTGLTPISVAGAGWTCVIDSVNTQAVACSRSDALANGSSYPPISITVFVEQSVADNVTNTATVSGGGEVNTANNSTSDPTTIIREADLVINKSGDTTTTPGSTVVYSISISNNGPSDASTVELKDQFPTGLSFNSNTGDCSLTSTAPSEVGCSFALIPVGESRSVNVTFDVAADFETQGYTTPFTNTATLTSPNDITTGNNSSSQQTSLNPLADLTLSKVFVTTPPTDPLFGKVVPGTTAEFTIVVTNNGPSDAQNVMVDDPAPALLTFNSNTGDCATAFPCSLGSIPAGQSKTINAFFNVPANYLALGGVDPFTNTASSTSTTPDPTAANNSSSSVAIAAPVGDLSLTKTDGVTSVVPGENITYTITVSNSGPSSIVGATVVDTMPTDITGVTWTCAPASSSPPSTTSCDLANGSDDINTTINIDPNEDIIFSATGTVNPAATGQLSNQASVTPPADSADPTPGDNQDVNELTPEADLRVTKSAAATINAGEDLIYTITVENLGPSNAANVVLSDALPPGLNFISNTGDCVSTFPCDLGTLSPGAGNIKTIVSRFQVPADYEAPSPIVNTASVTTTTPQPAIPDAQARYTHSSSTNLSKEADLGIKKTNLTTPLIPGQNATYTLDVTNLGPSDAIGALVSDSFDPAVFDVANITWTCSITLNAGAGSSCPASGTGNLNTAITLTRDASSNSNSVATFTITAPLLASATGNALNTATVTPPAGTLDPVSDALGGEDSDSTNDPLTVSVDLLLSKTNNVTSAVPGQSVNYTINVTNNGPSDATGARVQDTFDVSKVNVSGVTWSCAVTGSGSCAASGTGNIDELIDLSVGSSALFTITAPILPTATGNLVNSASVSAAAGTEALADQTNNVQTHSDSLTPLVNLSMTKTDGLSTVVPGAQNTYTLTLSNSGPSDLINATVSDPAPTGTSAVSWTCSADTGASCATSGMGDLSDTVNIPVGKTITYSYTVAVDSGATGSLVNTASINTPNATNTGANSAQDSSQLSPIVNLTISKDDGQSTVIPGESTTYTLTISNDAAASDLVDASFSDPLPNHATAGSWTCVASAGSSCAASGSGSIADTITVLAGGTLTYSFIVTTDPAARSPDQLVNTATVSLPAGTSNSPASSGLSASDSNTFSPNVSLSISKTDSVTTAVPGSNISYDIVVTNNGSSRAVDALVIDSFDPADYDIAYAGINLFDIPNIVWTCALTTGTGSCALSAATGAINTTVTLDPASSITLSAEVPILSSASNDLIAAGFSDKLLKNIASIQAQNETDAGGLQTDSDVDTELVPGTDLSIEKVNTASSDIAGTTTSYTITVTNEGPSAVVGASVTDNFDPNQFNASSAVWSCSVTPVSANNACQTPNGTGDLSALINLEKDAQAIFSVSVDILPSVTDFVENFATVSSPSTGALAVIDNNVDNDTNPDLIPLDEEVDLAVSKTLQSTTPTAGENLIYHIDVTNSGPSDVADATVADTFDPAIFNVSAISWTCQVITNAGAGSSCANASGTGNISELVTLTRDNSSNTSSLVRFVVTAPVYANATGSFSNTATITAPTGMEDSSNLGDNSSPVPTTLATNADLIISKTDNGNDIVIGETFEYSIVVTNNGPSDALSVSVVDTLPSSLTYVSDDSGGVQSPTGTITWSLGTLTGLATPASTQGQTKTIKLNVKGTAVGTFENSVSVSSTTPDPSLVTDPNSNTAKESTTIIGFDVSGTVFNDANTNSAQDAGELGIANVSVALKTSTGQCKTVTTLADGSYLFEAIPPANYELIEAVGFSSSVFTACPASLEADPSGYLSTSPNTLPINIVLSDISNQDFADFKGSLLTGTVFYDNAFGAGNANDALQNGSEKGVPTVTISVTDGGTERSSQTDGAGNYTIYFPVAGASTSVTLSHALNTPTGFNDGSSATLATSLNDPNAARATFSLNSGVNETYNFGVVNSSQLNPNQSSQASSPDTLSYTHLYRPATLGSVSLALSNGGYSYQVFLDNDCNGSIEANEQNNILSSGFTVTNSWPRDSNDQLAACALELRLNIPAAEPNGKIDIAVLAATLTWSGSTVADPSEVTDITTINIGATASITKQVRNVTEGSSFAIRTEGAPNDILEYCISYRNNGLENLTDFEISDPLPYFTSFLNDAYDTGTGDQSIQWNTSSANLLSQANDADAAEFVNRFVQLSVGTLSPGQTGSLCYQVSID